MRNQVQPGTWLTSRRLRAHGLLLGIALWSVYLWTVATPGLRDRNGNLKGTDFLHFYSLGWLAREHRGGELYDMNSQSAVAAQRVPEAAGIQYLPPYPPQVSLFFEPLTRFSYGQALAAWWIFSGLVYGYSCYGIWRVCPELRRYGTTVLLLAAAFPAFFHLIAWGQTSAVALALLTLALLLLRRQHEFLAGLALGCLIFKPQLGLAAALLFVGIGCWRVLLGAGLSAVAELLLGVWYYGMAPLRQWLDTIWNVPRMLPQFEPRPYQTHCLRTFWELFLPWPRISLGLYAISAILVVGATIALWRRGTAPLSLRYSALLLATVLIAPHLTVYDLVILAPALLLLADWLLAQPLTGMTRRIGTLLYLVYMLPLIGPWARWTHLQLSVVAMIGILYLIWQVSPMSTANGTGSESRRRSTTQ